MTGGDSGPGKVRERIKGKYFLPPGKYVVTSLRLSEASV